MNKYQFQEYVKCLSDKSRIYFIENYLSTFNADERKEVPFKLFPRQKVYLNTLVANDNIVTVKHRQCGITTVTSAWVTGQLVFAAKESPETVLCIGNKKDISEQLVSKIGAFLDQVPRWMWGDEFYSPDPDSPKNTKSIYKKRNSGCIELFNGCIVHARSSGENASRGISAVSVLIFDEAAFIQNGVSVYSSAVAACASVSHAKIVLISTPNGKDPLYWRTYDNAINKRNNFEFVEFKWFQDLRYNKNLKWIKKNEETGETETIVETVIGKKGEIKYDEERWRKLEKEGWKPTSPWYVNMCKSFNNDEQKIAQELDISFLGSSDTVVPVEVIEKHSQENVIEITDDWNLRDNLVKETWIWKDPIPGHRYICACLPEGEKVLTKEGYKNVENVTLNDILIDKDGNYTKIKKIYKRYVSNEKIIKIKPYNFDEYVTFTYNHPIWSSTNSINKLHSKTINKNRLRWYEWEHYFDFNKAEEIKPHDWIEIPNFYSKYTLKNDEIEKIWANFIKNYFSKIENPLLKEDFWWFCGMWLAEGFVSKTTNRIETVHHINEKLYHEKCINIIKNIFNQKGNIYYRYKCNAANVYFNNKIVKDFLTKTFGIYSNGKKISEWVKHLPPNLKLKLIEGYFDGDGCYTSKGITAVSVSKKLIMDIQDILHSCNYISSISHKTYPHKQTSYYLKISSYYANMFYINVKNVNGIKTIISRQHSYIKNDKILVRIKEIINELYTGIVYNFETETHTYCGNKITVHNCDPSSGSGSDYSAIQVIDVDAVDENGVPFFEQVLEYNGKLNGSEVGQLVYRYGTAYNDALAVVEAIGGYGDAIILTLQELGYSNLYYDDTNLKNYTNDTIKTKKNNIDTKQQLPGFRTNALRLQMISNFIELLKNNSFRVRSTRVISELGTWIFKNGRPDHMDGMNDDLLTCLAMGLFVMQFYMIKNDKIRTKDKIMVGSWAINNYTNTNYNTKQETKTIQNISEGSEKMFNPFIDRYKQNEKKHMNGCMMLGGFYNTFKHKPLSSNNNK